MFSWLNVFFVVLLRLVGAENHLTIEIEHKIGNAEYFLRGTVILSSPGEDAVQYESAFSWHGSLQIEAAKHGQMYCVRTKSQTSSSAGAMHSSTYVMSCVPACYIVQSDLSDVLTLSFDSTRQRIVALSISPIFSTSTESCNMLKEENIIADHFNTTIRLIEPVEGPVPETQAYLQKLEREKQEKVQGEQGDNRSFLAKYWMYIVPVLIVVMLSSVMNPEAAQQGR